MKYLVKAEQSYVDPHGSHDEGEVKIAIVEPNDKWNDIEGRYTYDCFIGGFENVNDYNDEEWKTVIDEGDLFVSDDFRAEDGYNADCWFHTYKEIDDETAEKYSKIIEDYNYLIKLL